MTEISGGFTIATYNIHKCRGLDQRISPSRVASVLRELDVDILCLQEVVNAPVESPVDESTRRYSETCIFDQATELARALPDYAWAFGANRPLRGGTYGNMTLSRLPIRAWRNHDISRERRERRGVLETQIDIGNGSMVHVFNVHLGTGHMERRFQVRRLLEPAILAHGEFNGPRLIIGDLNEWTRGLTTRLLRRSFQTFRPRHAARFPRTYPGVLPILSLDHCYYEPPLLLQDSRLWRTRKALIASDHLPLVANFRIS